MKTIHFADLEKWETRKKGLAARRELSTEFINDSSKKILNKLLSIDEVKNSSVVFCYAAMSDEVQTDELITELIKAGKKVSIPLIRSRGIMDAALVESVDLLVPGPCGVLSINPGDAVMVDPATIDCAIIPGSAFGRDGSRVGLGGGFYDRYLLKTPHAERIGICFDCQLQDKVPVEKHDIFMKMVVTEKEIIKLK